MSFDLCAIDERGMQAIFESKGAWFRISIDSAWRPIQLIDERDAIHCASIATYAFVQRTFDTLDALVEHVRGVCSSTVAIEAVPIEKIIHHFPDRFRTAVRKARSTRRLPYVIDNDMHRMADVVNQVLEDHRELAMDIATAYFNIGGYKLLAERLKGLGSLRLLLGA
jgi:hypothetical protein